MQTVSNLLIEKVKSAIQKVMGNMRQSLKARKCEIRRILNEHMRGKFRALKVHADQVVFKVKTALGFKSVTITA